MRFDYWKVIFNHRKEGVDKAVEIVVWVMAEDVTSKEEAIFVAVGLAVEQGFNIKYLSFDDCYEV